MPGEALFEPITTTDALRASTDSRAWLQAMLDAEGALARAGAEAGVVPPDAAEAIAGACRSEAFDVTAIGVAAREGGNPVIPLVRALRARLPDQHREWVHRGATSQDILDTAAVLVAVRSLVLVRAELDAVADGCAVLAERHRATTMAGRTLLQPALPITFGLKAAGWMVAVHDAADALAAAERRLASQLGGATGTLASLGSDGPAVASAFARHLGLAEPLLPWHAARQRIADLGCALAVVAGTAAKIALDVALLMQPEVGEAAEPAAGIPGDGSLGGPRGGSSTMPHKRNPVGAAAAVSAARRASALVPVLLGSLVAEHERSLGGWQAEWQTLAELLALAGGGAANAARTVRGIEVDAQAMAKNLAATGGAILAERVALALSPEVGHEAANDAVGRAARRSTGAGTPFADELAVEPAAASITQAALADLLDPAGYLGSLDVFIDRAIADHRARR